MVAKYLTCIK